MDPCDAAIVELEYHIVTILATSNGIGLRFGQYVTAWNFAP